MKRSVAKRSSPSGGASVRRAAASSERATVVPTATTRRPSRFARAIAARASDGMRTSSGGSVWASVSSTVTGLKVPAPTASVRSAISTPPSRSAARIGSVKWRPAVGAATASGSRAKTVW